jgi:hypothetical protein
MDHIAESVYVCRPYTAFRNWRVLAEGEKEGEREREREKEREKSSAIRDEYGET